MHLIRCSPPARLSLRSPESGAILSRTLSCRKRDLPFPLLPLALFILALVVCLVAVEASSPTGHHPGRTSAKVRVFLVLNAVLAVMGAWALPSCSHLVPIPAKCFPLTTAPSSKTEGYGLQVVWRPSIEADHTKHAPLATIAKTPPGVASQPRPHALEESQARCLIARLSDNRHPDNPWATKHTRTELLEVTVLWMGKRCCSE